MEKTGKFLRLNLGRVIREESIGRLTVYSRIILWVQPPVKELPTFPFLGFYSHNVTARHGIKKEAPSCAWRIRGESRKGKEEPAVT